ncbi:M15 family metallopeptidase [Virgibacillus natechei]|nr:M15 family metallopeptidase [Virgibacillus natechei]
MEENYLDMGEDAPLPDDLHPLVEEKKDILLEQAEAIDIDVVITDKTRSIDEQNELYEQGRSASGNIVTNAKGGESYHNYGLAIDYALLDNNGDIHWDIQYDGTDSGESDWFEVAELAKDLGFEWGGDWNRFPDYPHLQMDFGLSIDQLQRGMRPAPEDHDEADK